MLTNLQKGTDLFCKFIFTKNLDKKSVPFVQRGEEMLKYFIIYVIVINLIAFLAMYIDKRRAKYGKWRIPEQTLFILALIGGSIGAIAGMYTFRHKTKKLRFTIVFPVILVMQIILIASIWHDFLRKLF